MYDAELKNYPLVRQYLKNHFNTVGRSDLVCVFNRYLGPIGLRVITMTETAQEIYTDVEHFLLDETNNSKSDWFTDIISMAEKNQTPMVA